MRDEQKPMCIIQIVLPYKNKHIKKLLQCVAVRASKGRGERADAPSAFRSFY